MKTIIGKVRSAKMNKTVIIAVNRATPHPKYGKMVTKTSTFMAHDELGVKAGDRVKIVEIAPVSRLVRWKTMEVIK